LAASTTYNSAASLNGLVRNSTAPAFIAWTVIGTSELSADENDWHVEASLEPLLQFETAQARKPEIDDQAARDRAARMREKFLCRGEAFGLPARSPDKPLERFTDRDVVINDENGGCDVVDSIPCDGVLCGVITKAAG